MFDLLGRLIDDFKFRRAVGVSKSDLIALVSVLLAREDDEAVGVTLKDGTAGEIYGTRFDSSFLSIAVSGSYTNASQFVVCILDPSTNLWKDVLLAANWKQSFKPGLWQELVKSLVDTFVTEGLK